MPCLCVCRADAEAIVSELRAELRELLRQPRPRLHSALALRGAEDSEASVLLDSHLSELRTIDVLCCPALHPSRTLV